jgi:sulfur-oxidizing protein SoxA
MGVLVSLPVSAGPEEDRLAMSNYFQNRFPDVPMQEFANGLYAFDEAAREQWLEMEDFPPYEIAIEEGETMSNRCLIEQES